MKAAIYARYPTGRQNESSIANQVRICHDFASREGLTVVDQYDDQGISAPRLVTVPAFRACGGSVRAPLRCRGRHRSVPAVPLKRGPLEDD